MRNLYTNSILNKMIKGSLLIIFLLFAGSGILNAQVIKDFTSRMPVERLRGDFTLIGNKNLTVSPYSDTNDNGYVKMVYVNVAGGTGILNSSTANLVFSSENGATIANTTIKFAGLYWTGRAHTGNSPDEFTVNSITLNKRKVKFKVPGISTYYNVTANSSDIYYPSESSGNMYSAFADVTDIIKNLSNPSGTYTVANIALKESDYTDGTGFYGGWALLVVYENPAMNFRDVVVFDGHAYVAGNTTASYSIPVSGFRTTESGTVKMKLGLVAGEGDKDISGDYFKIRNHTNTSWISLSHGDNSTDNFFNSSIYTGGNTRNPNQSNNYGLDISMFYISNTNNSVITNNQTTTTFKYGSDQDTYIIFCIAMAVDAYIPEIYLTKTASPSTYSYVGQPITYTFKVENTGNLALSNVVVSDPTLGQTFGPITTLNAGSNQTYTYTYNVTQADLDAGHKLNTATATGYINSTPYSATDNATITADQSPAISLTKEATEQTFCTTGDIINYTLTLSNNGNLTVYNPTVTDLEATTGPTYISGDSNSNGILNVGESWLYTATYAIQQSDITNTTYTNIASASGLADTDGDGSGDKNVTASASETVTLGTDCCNQSVNAGQNITICEGEEINLSATFSDGTNYKSAIWTGPNGFSESSLNPASFTATIDDAGEYIISVNYGSICEAIDTVIITVNPLPEPLINGNYNICEGEQLTLSASGGSSYQWKLNGIIATTGTSYSSSSFEDNDVVTLIATSSSNCVDSTDVTIHVNPTYDADENTDVDTTICEADLPFSYEGTVFTAEGSKDITFQTVNGCDSVVTVNLYLNPTYTADENTDVDTTICEADLPFSYEGTVFTAEGSKDITFQTVNGCDSVVTVNLYLNPTYTADENTDVDTTICEADLPFSYEGTVFTAEGSKDITFQTVNGCDSVVTVNLYLNPTYTADENTDVDTTICEADLPFSYEGTVFTAEGSKDITFQTVNGCDSVVTVNLYLNPTYTADENTDVDTTICEADLPFSYEGTVFTAEGSKDITFQTVNGCDSVVTVNLYLNPTYTADENTDVDTTICEADLPFSYEGTVFTAEGSKDITFQTVNGCDSVVTVNLYLNPTYTADENTDVDTTICEADLPFSYEGTVFTAEGSKDITFQTVNGCDSVVTVNLYLNPTYTADENTDVDTTICEADLPFSYEGTVFTAEGSKDITFQTVNGCDSVVTVNLYLNPTYTADENTDVDTTICEADLPFSYEGTVFTAEGSKDITFQTVNGCDSVVTVNLYLNPTYTADENTDVDTTICEADLPFSYEGTVFTAEGSKDITFQTVNGCDSVVTVNLYLNPTYTADENTDVDTTICEADLPFSYEGTVFTAEGSKDITFQTVNGCDSVVTVNLYLNPTYTADENTDVDTTICEADLPFSYEGTVFTAEGSKDITFQTVNGCDSVVTVNLYLNPTYTADENTDVDTTICEADLPFSYEGTVFTAEGSKDITFQTVNGCDSVVTVNLYLNPTYTADENTDVDTTICEADLPFSYEGTVFTAEGSKDITFQTVNGCDSVVTVNLYLNPTYTADENTDVDTTICEADLPFSYEGTVFTAEGSKDITFQTVNGCDSVVTVNLYLNPTYTADENTDVDTTICEADLPFSYEGTVFTAEGSKDITFQTVNGCDSVVTVNLYLNPTYTADENTDVDTTICEADLPFSYEGTVFTAEGSKDITFQTVNGCDSVVTVNLYLNPTYTADENTDVDTTICEADLPFSYEGTVFTAEGSKDITFQTVNGCDSVVTVNLYLNPTYTADENTDVDTTICEADLPFSYEGTVFTAEGSKDITFQTVNGCDSVVTVNLYLNPTYTADENTDVDTTICEADLPFSYEGTVFTAEGSKDITFQTVNGCDSVVTVNLYLNPTYTADENTDVDTTICEADLPFSYEGTVFTAEGSKDITFQTVNGCDSVVTVNLYLNPTYTADENTDVDTTICEADLPFSYEGTVFTAEGSKDITFQTVNGCDSVVTVNLYLNPTYTADENTDVDTTICEADLPFSYEGTVFTAEGSKDITFQTVNGCDSVVTVNLYLNPTYTADENTDSTQLFVKPTCLSATKELCLLPKARKTLLSRP